MARELGRISLAEALELAILIARKEPKRLPRLAVRWLERYLQESEPTLPRSGSPSPRCRLSPKKIGRRPSAYCALAGSF